MRHYYNNNNGIIITVMFSNNTVILKIGKRKYHDSIANNNAIISITKLN